MILRQILVIDDNGSVRDAMDRILEDLGDLPFPAVDRSEALEMMSSVNFSAAVIDYKLGEDNAGEVLRERHPGLPVIVMSGKASEDELQTLVGGEANGYLRKPFTRDQLGSVLT